MRFLASSIGRKVAMAITGLALIGFLVMHLAGNLLMLVSPEAFNDYSHKLISNPFIYVAEGGLLLFFVSHLLAGFSVTRQSRAARPVRYAVDRRAGHTSNKSLASTTMIVSGIVLLVFVPIHLWTFKFGAYYETGAEPVRDLYRLVIEVFSDPLHVVAYVIAMIIIGFHLWHGFGSGFETLGIGSRPRIRRAGQTLAVLLAGGFALIPVVVFFMRGAS